MLTIWPEKAATTSDGTRRRKPRERDPIDAPRAQLCEEAAVLARRGRKRRSVHAQAARAVQHSRRLPVAAHPSDLNGRVVREMAHQRLRIRTLTRGQNRQAHPRSPTFPHQNSTLPRSIKSRVFRSTVERMESTRNWYACASSESG